jgi:hypothetical protein
MILFKDEWYRAGGEKPSDTIYVSNELVFTKNMVVIR